VSLQTMGKKNSKKFSSSFFKKSSKDSCLNVLAEGPLN
jgi:hypothetical protein